MSDCRGFPHDRAASRPGGYNLEDTKVQGERFISLVLLIAIAYTSATFEGQHIKAMQRGLGKAAPPKGVPPMSDCRGFPHERLHQDT